MVSNDICCRWFWCMEVRCLFCLRSSWWLADFFQLHTSGWLCSLSGTTLNALLQHIWINMWSCWSVSLWIDIRQCKTCIKSNAKLCRICSCPHVQITVSLYNLTEYLQALTPFVRHQAEQLGCKKFQSSSLLRFSWRSLEDQLLKPECIASFKRRLKLHFLNIHQLQFVSSFTVHVFWQLWTTAYSPKFCITFDTLCRILYIRAGPTRCRPGTV